MGGYTLCTLWVMHEYSHQLLSGQGAALRRSGANGYDPAIGRGPATGVGRDQ